MNIPLIVILLILFILVGIVILTYNNLNKSKNQISNAKSSLDALFIKRSELIPNLVTLVKQYMTFERDTLTKITAMRQPPPNAGTDIYMSDDDANKLLKQVMVQVENYPELKTSTQFLNLQYSWNEAEEQISAGRRFLSAAITGYNNAVIVFPGNLIAGIFGHKSFEWERATEVQQQNLNAKDLFKGE